MQVSVNVADHFVEIVRETFKRRFERDPTDKELASFFEQELHEDLELLADADDIIESADDYFKDRI